MGGAPAYIKCKHCNTTVINTNMTGEEFQDKCWEQHKAGNDFFDIEFAKKYGNNQFDQDVYNQRIALVKQINNIVKTDIVSELQPHCPTCQSTNIKKISATSKAVNAGLFGLLGNKRKKQFHCNNCGYEW